MEIWGRKEKTGEAYSGVTTRGHEIWNNGKQNFKVEVKREERTDEILRERCKVVLPLKLSFEHR